MSSCFFNITQGDIHFFVISQFEVKFKNEHIKDIILCLENYFKKYDNKYFLRKYLELIRYFPELEVHILEYFNDRIESLMCLEDFNIL